MSFSYSIELESCYEDRPGNWAAGRAVSVRAQAGRRLGVVYLCFGYSGTICEQRAKGRATKSAAATSKFRDCFRITYVGW